MDRYSLLGHVVPRVTLQTENAATEALSYLLKVYGKAREAFADLVSEMGLAGDEDLTFNTQVRMTGGGIPDLVGADASGTEVVLVESKFWAPLTPRQPRAYLDRLPQNKNGIVLFIAPEARHQTLWRELMDRCRIAGLEPEDERGNLPHWYAVRTSEVDHLAYVSWSHLLDCLETELGTGEDHGAQEVWQLRGLCERLITGDPVDPFEQLRSMVQQVAKSLEGRHFFHTKNYGVARGPNYYRRYGTMRGRINWFVEYDLQRASDLDESQLWVGGPLEEELNRKLSAESEADPFRFYKQGRETVFPLDVPTSVDPGVEVRELTDQAVKILEKLDRS